MRSSCSAEPNRALPLRPLPWRYSPQVVSLAPRPSCWTPRPGSSSGAELYSSLPDKLVELVTALGERSRLRDGAGGGRAALVS